jgi:hypothetical protein
MSRERRALDLVAATGFFALFFFSSATTDDIDGVTNLAAVFSTAGGTVVLTVVEEVVCFLGGVLGVLRLGPSSDFALLGDLARLDGLFGADAAAGASPAPPALRDRLLGDDMVYLWRLNGCHGC